MQSDYQTQPENIMNAKIAKEALQRYFVAEKIEPSGVETKKSAFNKLKEHNVLDHFSMPERALRIIFGVGHPKKRDNDGNPVKYAGSWYENLTKTISRIAQYLTEEEKIRVMNHYYSNQISVMDDQLTKDFFRYKLIRWDDKQKLLDYEVNIQNFYMAFNGGKQKESQEGDISQKMSKKQTTAYQPHEQLLEKVLHAVDKVDLTTARGVYRYQFLVAALIWLLAYRNRRLDIADTRLVDGPDVNVVLRQDGIFIKKTNKTHEPEVLLEFKDERLKDAVNTLVDIRKKQGKDRLFLKENGDISKKVKKWFGERFPEVMKQFGIGENLTMIVFRLAYGIKLSWEHVHLHNGSLASEMIIEDRMGHSFRMHQRKYNLTALENGEAVGESEDEDEDEEMGGASEEVVAEDASDEVAPEDASDEVAAEEVLDEVAAEDALDEEGNKCWIDEEGNWWGIDEEGNKCWIDEEGNKWWV
ncbi:hypothetical protein HK104_005233 [Borealophlyctis nickersoniae]|nr:hypothetical protein HK104_005233 [Borealophlyctis nickersoniae]